MKLWRIFFYAAAALTSCAPVDGVEDDALIVPDLSIKGLPSKEIPSNHTFYLTVTTDSPGSIDFKSSNPNAATITRSDRNVFKVVTKAPEKNSYVAIRIRQYSKGRYDGITKEISFTVIADPQELSPTMPQEELADIEGTKVSFTELLDNVTNPERGFFNGRDFTNSSGAIKSAEVVAQRLAGFSLWYMGFYLTDFMSGDISQDFLDKFQACMDALREGGSKCVLRFAYTVDMYSPDDKDPEVDIVLRHVGQLKPYLQRNEDVIFVLQAGFVGPWGEWHTSTHFGNSFELRRRLMDTLLDALPQSRQIQVRTPQFKMRMYDLGIKDTLTVATAHDGSVKSRIAGHNDCFGANVNDYGTFDNEPDDRDFWKTETRYVIMCGETCNYSDYCTCEATVKDLEDYHWSALNRAYNTTIINRWRTSGCFREIEARLGYRLVLRDMFYSGITSAGKPCSITLRFYNTGYAAPMNPRNAFLVWETPDGTRTETDLGSDPRTWQPGYHEVKASFTPSSDRGTLYLRLSDPLLKDRPEYCIALANDNVFDAKTGLNRLFVIN